MDWAFRVDTNRNSGGGHTHRTICLAKELQKFHNIMFFVNSKNDIFASKFKDFGFEIDVVRNFHKYNFYGCIFDGYNFKNEEINLIRSKVIRLVQIYDIGNIYDKLDLVVSSCINSTLNKYKKKKIVGFQYALVNPKFHIKNRIIKKIVRNIFIGFGLVDSFNFTLRILKIFRDYKLDYNFDNIFIGIGKESKDLQEIQKLKKDMRCNIIFKEFGIELSEILKKCDLAIGSGGLGMCERLCSGIPSIVIVTAENQNEIVARVLENNAIIQCGSFHNFDEFFFYETLVEISKNFQKRKNISKLGREIFDGKGVIRVSDKIHTL